MDSRQSRERERSRSPRKHKCAECQRMFSSSAILRRHVEEQHLKSRDRYICPYCPVRFNRKQDLDRHWQHSHKDRVESADRGEEVPRTPGWDLDVLSIHANSPVAQPAVSSDLRPPLPHRDVAPSTLTRPPLELVALPIPSVRPQTSAVEPPIIRRVVVTPEGSVTGTQEQWPSRHDVGIQTSRRVMVERTVKELMDGNTVVSRIVTEKFKYD